MTRIASLIAPCRNERVHIDAFCDAALAQHLPAGWALELLVADGRSDDGTRERLAQRCAADARLRWLDNPGRIVSTGLNACIAQARGEVLLRWDLHTRYADDYVAQCLAALARSGAANVGGPWVADAEGAGAGARAIAAAFQCRWVVGGARSRDTAYEGEVDTVYLGCWPRAVLQQHGGFDESLVRNQDDEHNLRLRQAGERIWQSPRIRAWYRPRASLARLWAQQRQYGYWRPFVMRKHGRPGSWRQLAPAALVAALGLAGLMAPWWPLPLAAVAGAYALYLLGASAAAAPRAGDAAAVARLPAVIAIYQLAYGLGSWQGLWAVATGRAPAAKQQALTR